MVDHTNRKMVWLAWGLLLLPLGYEVYQITSFALLGWLVSFSGALLLLRFYFPSIFIIEVSTVVTQSRFIEDPVRGSAKNTPPGYWLESQEATVSAKESVRCWLVFSLIAVMCACCAWRMQLSFTSPSWRLSRIQRDKLAAIAMEMPPDLSLLIEFPPAYNPQGQVFGKELREVISNNTKGKVNKIDVIYSGNPQLEGLAVVVPQEPPGSMCLSVRYGSALNGVMGQSGIESSLATDTRSGDCSSLIVYVGKQPKE
jgi:hypothetical protein